MTHALFETMTAQPAYDGEAAQLVELNNAVGTRVVLMDIGATWLSCRLPLASGEQREVLLGVGAMEDFQRQQGYLGVTVGRYANRIANGLFQIEGESYQVSTNQAGNCLHGGAKGFDKRRWQIVERSEQHVLFALHSKDGDQGFPGNVTVSVRYLLSDDNALHIDYLATSDKTTPINLTNHGYFNLNGTTSELDARAHTLSIEADYYLPTTEVGIPLGDLVSVEGTSFDFRQPKSVAADLLADTQQQQAKGYDHSFFLAPEREVKAPIATLTSQDERVSVGVITTQPAIQLYTGNWLGGAPRREGGEYQDYAGIALETQFLPDSPNHPEWPQPSCLLKPKEQYRQQTIYQFMCH